MFMCPSVSPSHFQHKSDLRNNTKPDIIQIRCEGVIHTQLAQDLVQYPEGGSYEHCIEHMDSIQGE
jgi:hypothetical protein